MLSLMRSTAVIELAKSVRVVSIASLLMSSPPPAVSSSLNALKTRAPQSPAGTMATPRRWWSSSTRCAASRASSSGDSAYW